MKVQGFKPNLIPNNPKDGSFGKEDLEAIINKNGGIQNYCVTLKKDGCRMQLGLGNEILTRSLKQPKSNLVIERFAALNQFCLDNNIAVDGEFYAHGMKFNEVFRFFSNTDVTRDKERIKLEKEQKKDPEKFNKDYNGRSIEWLTTFHDDLKFYAFDGIVLDRPDLVGFEERVIEINNRLSGFNFNFAYSVGYDKIDELYELQSIYEDVLKDGWEGLVLTHKDHEYKFGRNTLKQGTIIKMKDDMREYDGIVIDVKEGTSSIEGTEVKTNELGNSVRSQKKEDREPSGMASSFTVQFDEENTLEVCFKGFNHEQLKEIWENKENYIGRHFRYTGMKPVKNVPRHAFFDCWRDEK